MSLLCKEFIIYFSHLIIVIDIDWQVKYCQSHFSNGETEAQQKHKAKRWDQSPDVTVNVLSIPLFFPSLLVVLNPLHRQRRPIHVCGSCWDPVWINCKVRAYPPDSETWNSPRGTWSLKISSREIFRNSQEEFLYLLLCFLSVSFGRIHVWLWMSGLQSLRNNSHIPQRYETMQVPNKIKF